MEILIIASVFPPLKSSGAVQLYDLALEFINQGHSVSVFTPEPSLKSPYLHKVIDGINIFYLKTPKIYGVGLFRRTLGEFLMPFYMWKNIKKSNFKLKIVDMIVWYSPSIFLGPLVRKVSAYCTCPNYLILRDIFPDWAVDVGVIKKGPPYFFFKLVQKYQYSIATVIGVQSPGNLIYFDKEKVKKGSIEVLHNWLSIPEWRVSNINVLSTKFTGRKIFVYAGNMGKAQGVDIFLDLAEKFSSRMDVGFLFVGRGTEVERLKDLSKKMQLENILFFDEINSNEIPSLYSQCSAGIISLDIRHKSHNIPGKFLSYIQNGLPVLANVNPGNDIIEIINSNKVGLAKSFSNVDELYTSATILLSEIHRGYDFSSNCRKLSCRLFSTKHAAEQIISRMNFFGAKS